MQIYHYHPDTLEYMGTSIAQSSPLEPGKFLTTENSLAVAPPSTGAHQAAVVNGLGWKIVDDYRGEVYYLADGSEHTITVLGVKPPINSTATKPAPPPPTIEQIRAAMQCQAWQLRRALTQLGLRAAVEAAIAAADQDTKDMWEYATVYQRTHPIVASLALSLNKTDADIDDLFNIALTFTQ